MAGKKRTLLAMLVPLFALVLLAAPPQPAPAPPQQAEKSVPLPSGKRILTPVPGAPQPTNNMPLTIAVSPGQRYLALLNNGFGSEVADYHQSIAVFDRQTGKLTEFPESRLARDARQTYFLGLAFSSDGGRLYASIASITDPEGKHGGTGNGIAVYAFQNGQVSPQGFIALPPEPLPYQRTRLPVHDKLPEGRLIPYPAGLAVVARPSGDRLLVPNNLADTVTLLDPATGKIEQRFGVATQSFVPGAYPYAVAAAADGHRAWCSLWNASAVAELNLDTGRMERLISLGAPHSPVMPGSHPSALALRADGTRLYVALSNADQVAVVDTASGELVEYLDTRLPGQDYGGSFPDALAISPDGNYLFVANAMNNAVAVFDVRPSQPPEKPRKGGIRRAMGFIPSEWLPSSLAAVGGDLFIASGKALGTGPNADTSGRPAVAIRGKHVFIAAMLNGSLARVPLDQALAQLPELTQQAVKSNLLSGHSGDIQFASGKNPIHHVIYVIKENRTYDQVFGDLKPGNGDPHLVMYGEGITPNHHALARRFGILDNFYASGEVSGSGHVWSNAAIESDYTSKIWQIMTRGRERSYDFEGRNAEGFPMQQGQPDVNEPATGYLWTLLDRFKRSYQDYGEYIESFWCDRLSTCVVCATSSSRASRCPPVSARPVPPISTTGPSRCSPTT
jgi:DNA-binding beta-propeller fold protein YncE